MKKQNLAIFWLSIVAIIVSLISLLFDKDYAVISIACLFIFIITLKAPKIMYFVIYHGLIFGSIFYVIRVHWVPIFEDWSWGFWDINILGGVAWVLWFITYASFLTGLIYSVASCFDSTKLTGTQIGQLSVFGTLPEWGANQKNGRFGLFLGMPPAMVKIVPFNIKSKTVDIKDQSIQVENRHSGEKDFSIVCDGQFQWCFKDTLIASKNEVKEDDLKNLYKAALTSWFADSSHKYGDVDEAKAVRAKILDHIVSEMTSEAFHMYGVDVSGIKIINLETSAEQRKQQDTNAALLEKITADETAEMMSLTNHHRKVDYYLDKISERMGAGFVITPELIKYVDSQVLLLDKTVKRTEVKGASAFTRV